jgi:hypothetical protein
MAIGVEVFIAEVPVATSIICLAIGYLLREARQGRKATESAVSLMDRRVTVLETNGAPMDRRVEKLERRMESVGTDLAVVSAEFESHLGWHERQSTRSR